MKFESLDHELNSTGYLSLSKAVKWLKEYRRASSVSYPTALRLIKQEKLKAIRIGNIWRIYKNELDRFVAHGNREIDQADADLPLSPPSLSELRGQRKTSIKESKMISEIEGEESALDIWNKNKNPLS